MTFHNISNNRALFFLALAMLLACMPVQAQSQDQSPIKNKTGSIQIESEKLVLLHKKNQAIFTNRVHLTRDDFELYADRLVAYYNQHDLERAEAFGNIRLKQGDITGHSDKAILNQKSNTLTLIGHAVMQQQGNRLEGDRIIHDIKLEKTLVFPVKGGRTHMSIESSDETSESGPSAAGDNK